MSEKQKIGLILVLFLLLCSASVTNAQKSQSDYSLLGHDDDHDDDDHDRQECSQYCDNRVYVTNNETNSTNDTSTDNNTNQATTTQEQSQTYQQCMNNCLDRRSRRDRDQREYRGIFIAVACAAALVIILCCIFVVIRPYWKKRNSFDKQHKRRKPIKGDLTESQFQVHAVQFQNIFSEGERNNWDFFYILNGSRQDMQWFNIQCKKNKDFEYKVLFSGQDIYGQYQGDGYLANTDKGIVFWFFKRYPPYQPIQNQLIYQLIRNSDGSYSGQWYRRGTNEQGTCQLRRVGSGSAKGFEEDINYDGILSSAGSDMHL